MPPSFQSCYVNVKTYLTEHIEPLGPISEGIDDDVILSMVEHGLGLTVLPQLSIAPLRPSLVALPLPVRLFRTLGVAVKPGRAGLPHIHAFIEALRAHRDFGAGAGANGAVRLTTGRLLGDKKAPG